MKKAEPISWPRFLLDQLISDRPSFLQLRISSLQSLGLLDQIRTSPIRRQLCNRSGD